MFLVYSSQGWWAAGTWTSDIKVAKRFDREAAIEFCRKRYNPLGNMQIALPVREDDVLAVFSK